MEKIFKSVIEQGGYDLAALLGKIDAYHIQGRLSDAQREELCALARSNARAEDSVDLLSKLQELEARVAALENTAPETAAEAYTPGKWYYAGNQCLFEGEVYTCTAPEGVVCVWSPAEHPAYWEVTGDDE